jgi:hypothetical protein
MVEKPMVLRLAQFEFSAWQVEWVLSERIRDSGLGVGVSDGAETTAEAAKCPNSALLMAGQAALVCDTGQNPERNH